MALTTRVPRFFKDYVAGITAPWFVALNQSVNASVGIMGTLLAQSRDVLSQNNTILTATQSTAKAASDSATASQSSADASANSAKTANDLASQVQAIAYSYGKLWLGDLAADPSKDNNGQALVDGARYYNTTSNKVRVYYEGNWTDINQDAANQAHDATTAANIAAQAAASANSLYSQTVQNAAQSQNLLSQAQSILYWMNTYFLGDSSTPLTQDRNGNPITNGAWYYDTSKAAIQTMIAGIWKTMATTDITDSIKANYVQGTYALSDGTTQVKGLTWSTAGNSPIVYYVDPSGNAQSQTLGTTAQLTAETNRAEAAEATLISGTLGVVPSNKDERGYGLHWNGNASLPTFGYDNGSGGQTWTNVATQTYVDNVNTSLTNNLTKTQNDYVKRDGSLDMYGPLNIDLTTFTIGDQTKEYALQTTGNQTSGTLSASPSIVSRLTGNVNAYSGLKSNYDSTINNSYLNLYHAGDKGAASLVLYSDNHAVFSGDVWVGPDKNSYIHGKANYVKNADVAEYYQTDTDFEKGTVVKISPRIYSELDVARKGDHVFGIISSEPGFILNSKDGKKENLPVALAGRVPALVTGRIDKGDALVLSDKDGRLETRKVKGFFGCLNDLIKGREPEPIIAFALESTKTNGLNKIEVALK